MTCITPSSRSGPRLNLKVCTAEPTLEKCLSVKNTMAGYEGIDFWGVVRQGKGAHEPNAQTAAQNAVVFGKFLGVLRGKKAVFAG